MLVTDEARLYEDDGKC